MLWTILHLAAAQQLVFVHDTRLCLVPDEGSLLDGSPLQLRKCRGTHADDWAVTVENLKFGGSFCAGVANDASPGDVVSLAACNDEPGQNWDWGKGRVRTQLDSNLCLEADRPEAGASVRLAACGGEKLQGFVLEQSPALVQRTAAQEQFDIGAEFSKLNVKQTEVQRKTEDRVLEMKRDFRTELANKTNRLESGHTLAAKNFSAEGSLFDEHASEVEAGFQQAPAALEAAVVQALASTGQAKAKIQESLGSFAGFTKSSQSKSKKAAAKQRNRNQKRISSVQKQENKDTKKSWKTLTKNMKKLAKGAEKIVKGLAKTVVSEEKNQNTQEIAVDTASDELADHFESLHEWIPEASLRSEQLLTSTETGKLGLLTAREEALQTLESFRNDFAGDLADLQADSKTTTDRAKSTTADGLDDLKQQSSVLMLPSLRDIAKFELAGTTAAEKVLATVRKRGVKTVGKYVQLMEKEKTLAVLAGKMNLASMALKSAERQKIKALVRTVEGKRLKLKLKFIERIRASQTKMLDLVERTEKSSDAYAEKALDKVHASGLKLLVGSEMGADRALAGTDNAIEKAAPKLAEAGSIRFATQEDLHEILETSFTIAVTLVSRMSRMVAELYKVEREAKRDGSDAADAGGASLRTAVQDTQTRLLLNQGAGIDRVQMLRKKLDAGVDGARDAKRAAVRKVVGDLSGVERFIRSMRARLLQLVDNNKAVYTAAKRSVKEIPTSIGTFAERYLAKMGDLAFSLHKLADETEASSQGQFAKAAAELRSGQDAVRESMHKFIGSKLGRHAAEAMGQKVGEEEKLEGQRGEADELEESSLDKLLASIAGGVGTLRSETDQAYSAAPQRIAGLEQSLAVGKAGGEEQWQQSFAAAKKVLGERLRSVTADASAEVHALDHKAELLASATTESGNEVLGGLKSDHAAADALRQTKLAESQQAMSAAQKDVQLVPAGVPKALEQGLATAAAGAEELPLAQAEIATGMQGVVATASKMDNDLADREGAELERSGKKAKEDAEVTAGRLAMLREANEADRKQLEGLTDTVGRTADYASAALAQKTSSMADGVEENNRAMLRESAGLEESLAGAVLEAGSGAALDKALLTQQEKQSAADQTRAREDASRMTSNLESDSEAMARASSSFDRDAQASLGQINPGDTFDVLQRKIDKVSSENGKGAQETTDAAKESLRGVTDVLSGVNRAIAAANAEAQLQENRLTNISGEVSREVAVVDEDFSQDGDELRAFAQAVHGVTHDLARRVQDRKQTLLQALNTTEGRLAEMNSMAAYSTGEALEKVAQSVAEAVGQDAELDAQVNSTTKPRVEEWRTGVGRVFDNLGATLDLDAVEANARAKAENEQQMAEAASAVGMDLEQYMSTLKQDHAAQRAKFTSELTEELARLRDKATADAARRASSLGASTNGAESKLGTAASRLAEIQEQQTQADQKVQKQRAELRELLGQADSAVTTIVAQKFKAPSNAELQQQREALRTKLQEFEAQMGASLLQTDDPVAEAGAALAALRGRAAQWADDSRAWEKELDARDAASPSGSGSL